MLFAYGSRFGGHALYVKNNRLCYVNNFVGITQQKIDADRDLPTGENLILSALVRSRTARRRRVSATGILSLYVGDDKVGEGRIKTQPGDYGLGSGVTVGRSARLWPTTIRASGPGTSPAARSD